MPNVRDARNGDRLDCSGEADRRRRTIDRDPPVVAGNVPVNLNAVVVEEEGAIYGVTDRVRVRAGDRPGPDLR